MKLRDAIASWVSRAQTPCSFGQVRAAILADAGALLGCQTAYWGSHLVFRGERPTVLAPDKETRHALAVYAARQSRYWVPTTLFAIRAAGGIATMAELYSASELSRMPAYNEVVRPLGMRSVICAEVMVRGHPVSGLRFARHDGPALAAREKEILRDIVGVLGLIEATFRLDALAPWGLPDGGKMPPRLSQVADLAARGLGNKEIAARLGTSVDTVRKQLSAVYERFQLSGRVELALWWHHQRARVHTETGPEAVAP